VVALLDKEQNLLVVDVENFNKLTEEQRSAVLATNDAWIKLTPRPIEPPPPPPPPPEPEQHIQAPSPKPTREQLEKELRDAKIEAACVWGGIGLIMLFPAVIGAGIGAALFGKGLGALVGAVVAVWGTWYIVNNK
jgi:hypothetical protein